MRFLLKMEDSESPDAYKDQTCRTSTANDLTKRSHAPELTLNLMRFPFLNGTHSALRGELLAVQHGQGRRQASPTEQSTAHQALCVSAFASAHPGAQQEKATSSVMGVGVRGLEKPNR